MNFVAEYVASLSKQWAHDRTATIGASEIGQCARRVWFIKTGAEQDADYVDSKGAALRGDLIERHVWVPALRMWAEKQGATLHCVGDEQQTLADGYLSATCDGVAVMPDGEEVLRECKSIDPRVNLQEAKHQHQAQVQVQLGVVRKAGRFAPTRAIIDYIDASFLDNVTTFEFAFDQGTYDAAKARALQIMDATHPLQLRPEGKMAGGKECGNCPWASRCASEQVMGIPAKADVPLGDNAASALAEAVARHAAAREAGDAAKEAKAKAEEDIKEILRAHGARRYDGTDFGLSWSAVKGRSTTDLKAAVAAGIDLKPYTREGAATERLTISSKKKD